MPDTLFYAVFLFPQALEALGEPIKAYLQEGPMGPHMIVKEIDTSGAFVELTLQGQNPTGQPIEIDLLLPQGMIRMVVSVRDEQEFGFAREV